MKRFKLSGVKPGKIDVVTRPSESAAFGFCQFRNEEEAIKILHKLNRKSVVCSV
jgi:RNA recognition motif. (a.k.a. RRM, RBD, or RNP domain)